MNDVSAPVSSGQPSRSAPSPKKALGRTLLDFEGRFDEYPAERDLLERCRLGERCVLNDSKRPDIAKSTLRVRAGFIRFLALGGDDAAAVHEHGVVLVGAWIEEMLDLGDVELNHQLQLENCHLDGFEANDARTRNIVLDGSYCAGSFSATRCHCSMLYARGCIFKRGAELSYLIVDSDLLLERSRFEVIVPDAPGGGTAPEQDRQALALNLSASRVGGNVVCSDVTLSAGKLGSLGLQIACIEGYALLRRMMAGGAVSCSGAKFAANLDFSGTCIEAGGLDCNGVQVGGDTILTSGFVLDGTLALFAATIQGGLLCYAHSDPDERGLILPAMQIANRSAAALLASKAKFGQVQLNGAVFSGGVDFSDSVVEGELNMAGVTLAGKPRKALDFSRARVSSAFCFRDLKACLEEVAYETCVERVKATRESESLQPLAGAVASEVVHGSFELMQMRVASLDDDFKSWRLAAGKIDLDGFEYQRLTYPFSVDATTQVGKGRLRDVIDLLQDFFGVDRPEVRLGRVEWLRLQKSFNLDTHNYRPQPWLQLASTLRAMGDLKDARRVSIAQQYQLRTAKRLRSGELVLHYFFGLFSKFGYQPLRLAGWLCVPWMLASLLFWLSVHPEQRPWLDRTEYWIEPTKQVPDFECLARRAAEVPAPRCLRTPGYNEFFPVAYAADTLLPIINLGYRGSWQPVLSDAKGATSIGGFVVQMTCWFLIVIGWIGGAMLAGAVGALVRKD